MYNRLFSSWKLEYSYTYMLYGSNEENVLLWGGNSIGRTGFYADFELLFAPRRILTSEHPNITGEFSFGLLAVTGLFMPLLSHKYVCMTNLLSSINQTFFWSYCDIINTVYMVAQAQMLTRGCARARRSNNSFILRWRVFIKYNRPDHLSVGSGQPDLRLSHTAASGRIGQQWPRQPWVMGVCVWVHWLCGMQECRWLADGLLLPQKNTWTHFKCEYSSQNNGPTSVSARKHRETFCRDAIIVSLETHSNIRSIECSTVMRIEVPCNSVLG